MSEIHVQLPDGTPATVRGLPEVISLTDTHAEVAQFSVVADQHPRAGLDNLAGLATIGTLAFVATGLVILGVHDRNKRK